MREFVKDYKEYMGYTWSYSWRFAKRHKIALGIIYSMCFAAGMIVELYTEYKAK